MANELGAEFLILHVPLFVWEGDIIAGIVPTAILIKPSSYQS